ncbi:NYN domain-containing protein [Candidatus Peregrinibacteria bacterium]|nr:NYN domain-containing protein [Candidatus Peregrinibacteria bacterium]
MANRPVTYAFIDAQNLNLGVQSMGWKLDWKRFRVYLQHKYRIEKAFLFIGYVSENQRLYSALQQAGYILIFKPVLTGKGKTKGNVDAELVLHSMIEYPRYGRALIVTSDGDFACLVKYLAEKNKLAMVLSPQYETCSVLLRRAAKSLIAYLKYAREKLEYKKRGNAEGRTASALPHHRNSHSV